jgi:radical SAM protein with 4Fe4S-binding SPASM domain
LISLKRFSAEALIDSGITSLTVSTTGFDPAMYQRVYRSKMHQTVYDNIITFARANNARGRPVKFVISLRIDRPLSVVMRDKKFQAVAELVGPEHIDCNVYFDDWAGKVKASDLTGTMRIRNAGIARKMSFALRRPRVSPCTELYSGPVVYWDGKVGACGCRDVDARELIIGNLNDAHLAEIWFGRELERLRQDFMSNRVPQICRKCSHYNNVSYLYRPSNKPILDHYLSRACAADVAPSGQ